MIKKTRLKNGLKVLLIENHKSPVVAVHLWVRNGSADEPVNLRGVSHFIEHLVFKGTKKFGIGEVAKIVESSGGAINAYTSFDQTVYHVTISKEFTEVALEVISEIVGYPCFDNQEIENEKEVVLEEIKRAYDSPDSQVIRLLFEKSFERHPYKYPVIGREEVIKNITRQKIVNFFGKRYVPQNMTLVVVGDFSIASLQSYIKKYYGNFKYEQVRQLKRAKELKQNKAHISVKQTNFEESQLLLSWKTPKFDHKDAPVLDVLAMLLGYGDSARLVRRLRLDQALVNNVSSQTYNMQDVGMFFVGLSLNEEKLEKALAVVSEQLIEIMTNVPSAQELQRAITNIEAEQFYLFETMDGLARKAGLAEFLTGDYAYFKKYLTKIYAIEPTDICAVAKKYLEPTKVTIAAICNTEPTRVKQKIKFWLKTFTSNYCSVSKSNNKQKEKFKLNHMRWKFKADFAGKNSIHKAITTNGAIAISQRINATPLVSARAAFLGGLRNQPMGKEGIAEMLARIWTSGTKNLSEQELFSKIEAIAGSVGGFAGRNSIGLYIETISPFADIAKGLFTQLMTEPIFDEEVLEREKKVLIEQIRIQNDDPAYVAMQLFLRNLFPQHPYGLDILGSEQSVQTITRNDVLDYWAKTAQAQNLAIIVGGAFQGNNWPKALKIIADQLTNGQRQEQVFSLELLQTEIKDFLPLRKEQTHLVYGYRGLTLADKDRYVLQVIQAILAGQGGRLFLKLRDQAALAYAVMPIHFEGIDTGCFGAYIACSPEKAKCAIDMLGEQFEMLTSELVGDQELSRAARYLIGHRDIGMQKTSVVTSNILFNELYNIGYKEIFEFADKIRGITAQDILRVSQKIFTDHSVVAVVGSQSPF